MSCLLWSHIFCFTLFFQFCFTFYCGVELCACFRSPYCPSEFHAAVTVNPSPMCFTCFIVPTLLVYLVFMLSCLSCKFVFALFLQAFQHSPSDSFLVFLTLFWTWLLPLTDPLFVSCWFSVYMIVLQESCCLFRKTWTVSSHALGIRIACHILSLGTLCNNSTHKIQETFLAAFKSHALCPTVSTGNSNIWSVTTDQVRSRLTPLTSNTVVG